MKRRVSEKIVQIVGQMFEYEARVISVYECIQESNDEESILWIFLVQKFKNTNFGLCLFCESGSTLNDLYRDQSFCRPV